jgi:hypothetical protein
MAFRGRILCALTFSCYTWHLHFIMFLNKDSLWLGDTCGIGWECTTMSWWYFCEQYPFSFWNNGKYFGFFFWNSRVFFLRDPVRRRRSHTRVHTHPYERTHAHPTHMSTSEELSWTGKFRDWRSHHRRLAVDGHVAYHWKNSAVKSWNKSRKMQAPVSSRGFEPRWAGSTTRNPTSSLGTMELYDASANYLWRNLMLPVFSFPDVEPCQVHLQ